MQKANLQGANLLFANLKEASLVGADLRAASLQGAYLLRADLSAADLRGADLGGARLGGGNLFEADLRGADLSGADLAGANLKGAVMGRANLDRADVQGVRNLVLDSTDVRNTRFSARAGDPWSILRRAYTGPKLFFNLLLLTAFLLPYVMKTFGWVGANRVQEEVRSTVEKLQAVAANLEQEEHPMAKPMSCIRKRYPTHMTMAMTIRTKPRRWIRSSFVNDLP